jgi:uncharacterized protein (TIGR03067 family)
MRRRIGLVPLCAAIAAVVASLAFAPAPLPRRERASTSAAELRRLQGDWVRVSLTVDGRPIGHTRGAATVRGDRMFFTQTDEVFAIALDAAAWPPRLDFERLSAVSEGAPPQYRGIYRLEGDKLTLCLREGKDPRPPARFDETGDRVCLEVYLRPRGGGGGGSGR